MQRTSAPASAQRLHLDTEPSIFVRPRQDPATQAPPTPPAETALPSSLSRSRTITADNTPEEAVFSPRRTSSPTLPAFLAATETAAGPSDPSVRVKEENSDSGIPVWPWGDKEVVDLTDLLDSPLGSPTRELDYSALESELHALSQVLEDVTVPEQRSAERKRTADTLEEEGLSQGVAKRLRVSAAEDVVMEDPVVDLTDDINPDGDPTIGDDSDNAGESTTSPTAIADGATAIPTAVEELTSILQSEDESVFAAATPQDPIVVPSAFVAQSPSISARPPPASVPPSSIHIFAQPPSVSAQPNSVPAQPPQPPPETIPLPDVQPEPPKTDPPPPPPPPVRVKAESDEASAALAFAPASEAAPKRSLSMRHLNLAYHRSKDGWLICRMCL